MANSPFRKPISGIEYVGNVYWWQNTWTCPVDGIANVVLGAKTGGAKTYWYISDDDKAVCRMNQTADGTSQTCSFPVIAGKTYRTDAMDNVDHAEVQYYKFV